MNLTKTNLKSLTTNQIKTPLIHLQMDLRIKTLFYNKSLISVIESVYLYWAFISVSLENINDRDLTVYNQILPYTIKSL